MQCGGLDKLNFYKGSIREVRFRGRYQLQQVLADIRKMHGHFTGILLFVSPHTYHTKEWRDSTNRQACAKSKQAHTHIHACTHPCMNTYMFRYPCICTTHTHTTVHAHTYVHVWHVWHVYISMHMWCFTNAVLFGTGWVPTHHACLHHICFVDFCNPTFCSPTCR